MDTEGTNGNPGISKLGRVLHSRIKAYGDDTLVLDFGTIQSDFSLLTNTYPIPIPKSDYTICRHLTIGSEGECLTSTVAAGEPNDGTHSHGSSGGHDGHTDGDGTHTHDNEAPHVHDVLLPDAMQPPQAGDRVLVAWVQNEAVVVDIIMPAAAL